MCTKNTDLCVYSAKLVTLICPTAVFKMKMTPPSGSLLQQHICIHNCSLLESLFCIQMLLIIYCAAVTYQFLQCGTNKGKILPTVLHICVNKRATCQHTFDKLHQNTTKYEEREQYYAHNTMKQNTSQGF